MNVQPVDGWQTIFLSICLHLCQLFICAEAWIHKPIIHKLVHILLVQLLTFRLAVRAMRSTNIGPCKQCSTSYQLLEY